MRVIILASSVYSERAVCIFWALTKSLAPPVACISAPTLSYAQLRRKAAQLGPAALMRMGLQRLGLSRARPTAASTHGSMSTPWAQRLLDELGVPGPIDLRRACAATGTPLVYAADVNKDASLDYCRGAEPDLLIYTGGGILRKPLISTARIGVLNTHAGPLPAVRGMNAVEWCVLQGLTPGISLHFIDAGVDTGDILEVLPIGLSPADQSFEALGERIMPLSVDLMVRGVRMLSDGSARRTSQSPSEGKQYFVMHEALRDIAARNLRAMAAGHIQ